MQELNIKKYIRVESAVKKQLADKYKVSMPLICMALSYEKKGGKSKWIRIEALQLGGEIIYEVPEHTLIQVAKGEITLPCMID